MPFWTYVLRCGDGSYYAGHTDDIDQRLGQHRAGEGSAYTQMRLPVALVFSEQFADRDSAFHFERRIKGWSRVKKEALFDRDWERVSDLAIPPSERRLRLREDAE